MVKLVTRIRNMNLRRRRAKFFDLPYKQRRKIIAEQFDHESMLASLNRYLAIGEDMWRSPSFFWDMLLASVTEYRPQKVINVGCFSCSEARFLISHDYQGEIVNCDFNSSRVEYLKNVFSGGKYQEMKFEVMDLEAPDFKRFLGTPMVVASAVFPFVQPEGARGLIRGIYDAGVELLILSTSYSQYSVGFDSDRKEFLNAAQPGVFDNSWYHRIPELAESAGYQSVFWPDFGWAPANEARGIWLLHIDADAVSQISEAAAKTYLARQREFPIYYDAVRNLDG